MNYNDVTLLFISLSQVDGNNNRHEFLDAQNLLFACDFIVGKYPKQVNDYLFKPNTSLLQLIAGNDGNIQYEFKKFIIDRYGVVIP